MPIDPNCVASAILLVCHPASAGNLGFERIFMRWDHHLFYLLIDK